ncbi:MAG: hypothetical protein V1757_03185 [Actinomycetota bacterium]
MTSPDPDRISAWVTGVGVGLIGVMVTWLVVSRLAGLFWDAPVGPIVALSSATVVGLVVTVVAGRRLAATAARR